MNGIDFVKLFYNSLKNGAWVDLEYSLCFYLII